MICKHFGICGGCSFQDIDYTEQLRVKEENVKKLISEQNISTQLKPVNHYPIWYYRNKMEFAFSDNGAEVVCGLYQKKGKDLKLKRQPVLDLEECLIFSPNMPVIFSAIKAFIKQKKYPAYNKYNYQGFLRHLVVRETKFTKQLMIGIVTTSKLEFDKGEFVRILQQLQLTTELKSIYHVINDSASDAVIFEKKDLLFGEPFIVEQLGELKFNIGIDTFFQVNPVAINDFYKKIKTYAALSNNMSVLDLFCGVGSIGIFLAGSAKFVWGVEVHKEITDAAWENAKANNINNISFFTADTRVFLNTQGSFYHGTNVFIINPPRSGVSPKIIRAIIKLSPKIVIYSSCNPNSLFTDLAELSKSYNVEFIEPFDFFPHTPHLECLAFLTRKNIVS